MHTRRLDKKLRLSRETIRELTVAELGYVAGAGTRRRCPAPTLEPECDTNANCPLLTVDCPPPSFNGEICQ